MPRAVVFRGTRELQKAEMQGLLGLNPGANPRRPGPASPRAGAPPGVGRFLLSVGENDFALESAIEDLQVCLLGILGFKPALKSAKLTSLSAIPP